MSRLTPPQLVTLCDMLSYGRPHGSWAERAFTTKYLDPLPGIVQDDHGNYHVKIGISPILWSSHTDTVHDVPTRQSVRVNPREGTVRLSRRSKRSSRCLGADDTVGVFLMREMILAGVPGHYIFHYGEESGCIGSSDLAQYSPHLIGQEILYAIALDRAGTSDVITSQLGDPCCSDTFARSLALQLPGTYHSSPGVYTDTAQYTEMIPECTNLSVGYYSQHSSGEWIDYFHIGDLLSALCVLDSSRLVCHRDPTEPKPRHIFPTVKNSPRTSYGSALFDIRGPDDLPGTEWCHWCDAPKLTEDDHLHDVIDRCLCDDEGDSYSGLSEDDAKFLRYLRSR